MEKIRIGIFGAGRGIDIAENLMLLGCEIVALCDFIEDRRNKGIEALGENVKGFDNFDDFIKEDMDAVVLANFFNEHAPYAIKCFEKGIHVFSECISNGTLAEGVELVRAFEKSNSIYMLAENYPQMIFNREIKRVCDGGTLGKILYAEGEYNHPVCPDNTEFNKDYIYFVDHWRNFNPRSYYITHSLAPIMWATGATPKRVSALPVYAPLEETATARHVGDRAAIITTLNDDGSVFRVTGCAGFGAHHNAYRVCGTEGQIENLRGMGDKVMLRYSEWAVPEGMETENLYTPEWNDKDEELIVNSGHGGGDYIIARMFLDCIREHRQPEHPFDIYSAVNMSSVAILSHRSILNGGIPYDIPDMTSEEDRLKYENDRHTPYFIFGDNVPDLPYGSNGKKPDLPCCSNPDYKPSEEQIKAYIESLK
ncbi:MAG: Gfo/Idh/MocA family oxidoreductase [Oscillospiraceae bacterium]|nr:Gfo/Idh/MocA family oxidoreductase [Oscillospiraceae bacterium]